MFAHTRKCMPTTYSNRSVDQLARGSISSPRPPLVFSFSPTSRPPRLTWPCAIHSPSPLCSVQGFPLSSPRRQPELENPPVRGRRHACMNGLYYYYTTTTLLTSS
ncbi:hypothetical protein KCU88_g460, partial [Aureobasidium melanogenum]